MKPIDETSVKPYLTPGQKALREMVERYLEKKREAAIADATQYPQSSPPTTDPL